jgi:hypothetical protein
MGIIEVSRLCGKCFEIDGKEIPVVGHKCPYYKKNKMEKPKCAICGKEMKNAVDSKTKKISPYLWKTTCEHNKNLILARG